ncbi:hypothetical protein BGZ61DRAFT_539456 [Ilyonectria robusta]|uniref:uncharacterized protein n=1 Tax=Ilyonectria robusta TaxID=1079257 RepID=UPI001E8D8026|nr:uncharacterized protein BGZ61DRAFT_539456 [Ilyonectria robusta]KAH8662742.1 hypothetical protein BGZ61DRAFT_539456 [Ilyonectria robusta]
MLLKYFLLNTLLALSSVTAIPSPDTDNYDVEARNADDDPAGHLVDRAGRCGSDAYWNRKQHACICRRRDEIFDKEMKKCCPEGKKWDGHRCKHDCGEDADWDRNERECVCKKKHARFENKQCTCPGDMWEGRNECHCKRDMFWSDTQQRCRCHGRRTFDKITGKCKPHH